MIWPSGIGNGTLPLIPELKQVPPTWVTQQDTVSKPNQTKPDKTKTVQPNNQIIIFLAAGQTMPLLWFVIL